jgi:hypothetical protein
MSFHHGATPGPEASLTPQIDQSTEFLRARSYLTSITAYASFDLTHDGRVMSGCMDPRADEGVDRQMTKMMGPGGQVGESADHSLALTAVGRRFVTIEEGQEQDVRLRRTSVHGAHFDCAFVGSFWQIMGEMAQPSVRTKESVDKWVADHELGSLVTHDVLGAVQDAAAQQTEHGKFLGAPEHLVHAVDSHHPDHHNVPHMRGQATPRFYIVNGYPNLGVNRHAKHNTERLQAQAYQDNVGARLGDVHNTHALPYDVRWHRMGALLLRSAATRTVIDNTKRAAGHPLDHWEIEIGDNGPIFRPVSLS